MDPEEVEETKTWLAIRKAWLDQKKKQFEEQYASVPPRINYMRLTDLEVWAFEIEILEWEFEQTQERESS